MAVTNARPAAAGSQPIIRTSRIMVADIKRVVAREYGVPVAAMSEPAPTERTFSNLRPTAHARQAAILLGARLTDYSNAHLGRLFGGRDHTTVLHAIRATQRRLAEDRKLATSLRRMTLELVRGGRCA